MGGSFRVNKSNSNITDSDSSQKVEIKNTRESFRESSWQEGAKKAPPPPPPEGHWTQKYSGDSTRALQNHLVIKLAKEFIPGFTFVEQWNSPENAPIRQRAARIAYLETPEGRAAWKKKLMPYFEKKFQKKLSIPISQEGTSKWVDQRIDKHLLRAKNALPVLVDVNLGKDAPKVLVIFDHHEHLETPDGHNASQKVLKHMETRLKANNNNVATTMKDLSFKKVATNNLGDGALAVWMLQHPETVLQQMVKAGGAEKMVLWNATQWEDFGVFSTEGIDSTKATHAQKVAAAYLYDYDRVISDPRFRDHFIPGTDRLKPDTPQAIARKIMQGATSGIENATLRPEAKAALFFKEINEGTKVVQNARIPHLSNDKLVFVDMDQVSKAKLGRFAGWAASAKAHQVPIQVTVKKLPGTPPKYLYFAAIPFGEELPSGKNMLYVNKILEDKVGKGVFKARANVVFGVSELAPDDFAKILMDEKLGLFESQHVTHKVNIADLTKVAEKHGAAVAEITGERVPGKAETVATLEKSIVKQGGINRSMGTFVEVQEGHTIFVDHADGSRVQLSHNGKDPTKYPVSRGDVIRTEGSKVEVLITDTRETATGPTHRYFPEEVLKDVDTGPQSPTAKKAQAAKTGPKLSQEVTVKNRNWAGIPVKGVMTEMGGNVLGFLLYMGAAKGYKSITGKDQLSTAESLMIGGGVALPFLGFSAYQFHKAGYSWLGSGGRSLLGGGKFMLTSAGAFVTGTALLHFTGVRGWKRDLGGIGIGTLLAATPLGRAITTGLAGGGYLGMKIDEWTDGAWGDWGCSVIEDNVEFGKLVKNKVVEVHGDAVDIGVKAIENGVELYDDAVDVGVDIIGGVVDGAGAVGDFLSGHSSLVSFGGTPMKAIKFELERQRAKAAKLAEEKRIRVLKAKEDGKARETQKKVAGNPVAEDIFTFMLGANKKPESMTTYDELTKAVGSNGTLEFLELHDDGTSTFKITLSAERGKNPVEITWRPGTEPVVLDPSLHSVYGHYSYAPVAYR